MVSAKQTLSQPARQFWKSAEGKKAFLASSKRRVKKNPYLPSVSVIIRVIWSDRWYFFINMSQFWPVLKSHPQSLSKGFLNSEAEREWVSHGLWVTAQSRSGNSEKAPGETLLLRLKEKFHSQQSEEVLRATGDKKGHIWELRVAQPVKAGGGCG